MGNRRKLCRQGREEELSETRSTKGFTVWENEEMNGVTGIKEFERTKR